MKIPDYIKFEDMTEAQLQAVKPFPRMAKYVGVSDDTGPSGIIFWKDEVESAMGDQLQVRWTYLFCGGMQSQ